jgi:hypothetical protein
MFVFSTLTLHADIGAETVKVRSRKLEDNELAQSGDIGGLDLSRRWN